MIYNIEELKSKTIGAKIRQAREQKGKEWSQKRLALECGLSEESRQTVAAWEKGTKLPTFDQMLTLCNIFNVEITFFLGDDCTNHNWEYIHQETGLSEPAINKLHQWNSGNSEIAEKGQEYTNLLNLLLSNYYFDEFLYNITHYLMLANYTNPNFVSKIEQDEISEIISKHQMDAMTYIEEHDPSYYITAFIALKSNLRPDDLATHYLQEASDNIKYAIKEISRQQSAK